MAVAVPQGVPHGGVRLTQGHKGIELADLLEKLLQLGFGH
jgi:hypothetical protein